MGRRPPTRDPLPQFTQSQIQHIKKALNGKDVEAGRSFFQKLAMEVNTASGLTGKRAIHWGQLKRWHEQNSVPVQPPEVMSNEQAILPDISLSNNTPESSTDGHKDEGDADELQTEYEARSCRDGAWYDVVTFLDQRVGNLDEPEVHVRYQGFGPEEDEWVNLKKAVRQRSIPFDSSECCNVAVGDLVLCFWEREKHAAYYDARVIDIQRKLHDIRGCRCVFLIRYDHEPIEERVHLRRLCRRPEN